MLNRLLLTPLLAALWAQNPQTPPATSRPGATAPMHWAQRLGARSLQLTNATRTIDRCVLVPDAATYIDELMKWSSQGAGTRWPVLIEDDVLTPLFVRRFTPAELIRRDAVGATLPDDPAQRRSIIESAAVRALGGDAAAQSMTQVLEVMGYRPPGVVVASAADPAWTAALALAAGRAQPIIWVEGEFGAVNDVLDDAGARRLAADIGAGIDALQYSSTALGDDIDAVTLCRNLPVAASMKVPSEQRLVREGPYADGNLAVSDLLGRNADGTRFAFVGQIFGDEKRCAYMAMCSLFLPHESATLLNAYSREGEWGTYSMDPALEILTNAGLQVRSHSGPEQMGEAGWRRLLPGGISSDVVFMNSGGNADFFILNGAQAPPGEIPILNQPAAVHLIHSWSLRSPTSASTVGGRWIEHGAYAMVGSCFEPFLGAFHQPRMLAARCMAGVPFLVAARRWDDDGLASPWRVVTIGDPLMVMRPTQAAAAARIPQPAAYGENLTALARDRMKAFDADNDPGALTDSIRTLELLDQDDLALKMWELAQQRGIVSGKAASAILGSLFRARDSAGFLRAWQEGGPRSAIMLDMLWQLMGPHLGATLDRDMLLQLEHAVRSDMPAADVEKLAPALDRVFGRAHVRQFIGREIERARGGEHKQQLRDLAGRY